MIPKIYDRDNNYIGELPFCTRGLVIEERNGMFELELDYRLKHKNYEYLVRGNIIEVDANDKQKNQLFRIYKVTKDILGQFSVYATHISYDIARDYTEGLEITNQSCEYCLNQLFRTSQFSQKFTGYSNIVNAQDYKMGNNNLLLAISGARGSILDTFGTGAEVLRDNYDFHVLDHRGRDNDVVVEYASNLTGLDYEEDDTSLITRIRAFAKYTLEATEEGQQPEEQIIYTYVDSPNIGAYETPFIGEIDFSEKFGEKEIPTVSKLKTYAEAYFKNNKCDVVKFNYKISFIPLSKCAGYEDIEDKIELCDTVTIIDKRYGLNTKAKVVKVTYDFLRDRYDSMELGEPRTSLGDVVGGSTTEGIQGPPGPPGPQGPQGEPGTPGDTTIDDFPDTLPATPVLNFKLYGFASIELSWTFESKVYYTYELYASKTKGFTPNTFDLIHEGQTSSYLYQVEPNETWYFRVCAKNSYGNRTAFSEEVEVAAKKIEDLSNYVENMAISDALIGELSLDRGWVGQLNASLLDVKGNFSVTDGNGKRTLDIDSFGNVYLDVAKLSINSSSVAKESYVDEQVDNATNDLNSSISSVQQTANKINWLVKSGTSSSNMSLTSDALRIISSNIDITGKVTFNSFNSSLQNQINNINNSANNAVSTANNALSKADNAEYQVDFNSPYWDAAYDRVLDWSEDWPTNGYTTINGGHITTGSITASKIAANTISVDMLKANNANPIIRLFGTCALDATRLYEEGVGTAIRLKWDDSNYILVTTNSVQIYTSNGGESAILNIRGDSGGTTLNALSGGTLKLSGNSAYYNNSLMLTANNYSSYCAPASHSHNYASSSHGHDGYASSSHTHDRISNGGGKIQCYSNYVVMDAGYSCNVRLDCGYSGGGNYKLYAVSSGTDLGSSSYKWRYVFSQNALQTSDIKYKENIQYLDDNVATFSLRGRKPTPFLDFMRDSFKPAIYDYKVAREEEGHVEADRQIGFIANDIIDNEVGQTFLYNFGTDGDTDIMFSQTGYTTVVARALQEEIQERENEINELKTRIELLEEMLNQK